MKLTKTLIIVADLGELKAYDLKEHKGIVEHDSKVSYSLELLTDMDYIDAHKKLHEVVSDEAGRFGHLRGEEHDVELEREKRTLKNVAHDIDRIVEEENPEELFLAFPKALNTQLVEKLNEQTKSVLSKNLALDLVKTDREKILSHFQEVE